MGHIQILPLLHGELEGLLTKPFIKFLNFVSKVKAYPYLMFSLLTSSIDTLYSNFPFCEARGGEFAFLATDITDCLLLISLLFKSITARSSRNQVKF